jgi:O-acetyl-ADP-ribose deacetylase (regulator of RNase III)
VYRFPKQQAAQIAVNTVKDFVKQNENHEFEDIIFVCFDAENYQLYLNLVQPEN